MAIAYELRRAEAPADDAVLDTLARTLEVYEQDIRQRGEYHKDDSGARMPWLFPERLELAARLAGAFRPRDRGELGDLMAELVEDFDLYAAEMERRIKNAAHGRLPDGVEEALGPVVACTSLLWDAVCELAPPERSSGAARRYNRSIDYLAEHLHEHVAKLHQAIYGFDDEEDLAA